MLKHLFRINTPELSLVSDSENNDTVEEISVYKPIGKERQLQKMLSSKNKNKECTNPLKSKDKLISTLWCLTNPKLSSSQSLDKLVCPSTQNGSL